MAVALAADGPGHGYEAMNEQAIGRVGEDGLVPPIFEAEEVTAATDRVAELEAEYKKMRGELKKRAAEVRPIGFIHEGMVEPTRDRKHGDAQDNGIE